MNEEFKKDMEAPPPALLKNWFRHDTWYREQAMLLLIGLDPDGTEFKRILTNPNWTKSRPITEPSCITRIGTATFLDTRQMNYDFQVDYKEELTALQRNNPVRLELLRLSDLYRDMQAIWTSREDAISERQTPEEWIKWAQSKGFEIPWLAWARDNGLLKKPRAEEALSNRVRTSLLKLVLGMAMGGYAYDPKANRNDATSDIAEDLTKQGLSLDQETILKYLKEASDTLLEGK